MITTRPLARFALALALTGSALAASIRAQAGPADQAIEIPSSWFKKLKGYDEARALQKETGVDLVVFFYRTDPPNEERLCNWFEEHGLNKGKLKRALRHYIKVRIDVTRKSDDDLNALVDRYMVGSTPVFIVVHPDGQHRRTRFFDWPDGRPELKKPGAMARDLVEASSEAQKQRVAED